MEKGKSESIKITKTSKTTHLEPNLSGAAHQTLIEISPTILTVKIA
jgi:hypothetical protein